MTMAAAELGIFDPETYAQGNSATFGLPLDSYAYLRDNAPVYLQEFSDPLLIDRAWVLSRYEDIVTVDKDPDAFAADLGSVNIWRVTPIDPFNGGMPAMLTSDGPEHRRQRGVLSKGFTPRTVRKLEEMFRVYAKDIVGAALEKGTINFVTDVAHAMPMEALGDVLGVPPADRAKFFGWVDQFAAPFDTRITPSFDHVIAAIGDLMNYSIEIAELKTRCPADDVMSIMVNATGDQALSEDQVMGNVALLASGAAESTRTSLSHGMHQLMRDRDQMTWLRERSADIPATAIQEMVRIATPFTHLVRTARRDVEFHGTTIPEGDIICMLFTSGNFDERAFDEPEKFKLDREPNLHLSFGRGPHQCLGKHVASLEMKILMEELLQRTKDIQPAGDIQYVKDNYSRGVYELPVTLIPA
ncbi:cytochrome P450 [Mycolicibacterium hodleri]|uniref:Steroid C26-monooxygenase n=1 Tax=Mycolicibacterium hodleri TaxID=49897 RepID=A0A502E4G7_9MYCO|nr:cytochrome P450 [Mycolicibacterium hodleri]TPG32407.1 cytochrome P450 [Mycolicibacterium hodleri]